VTTAREAAYQALLRVEQGEAFTNLALQQALRASGLAERDRALCTEIVYGTIQRRRSLDALLRPQLRRPPEDLDTEVLTILRMTVYQLAYLNRVPAYAALNEAVELCKKVKPHASGFVNGVLRQFSRVAESAAERLERMAREESDAAAALGVRHSYPDWLVSRLMKRFGHDRTEALLRACNEKAPMSVRVNRLRTDVESLRAALAKQGIEAEPSPLYQWGLRLIQGVDAEAWAPYREGKVTVQDEGAMLIAPLLQVRPGNRVLDLCAAPGGKTTHIAEEMRDQGRIDAVDIHPHKLGLLRKAAVRLGLRSIWTVLADGRELVNRPDFRASFDAVLLDAPCSGLGVLRHRPDIRWRRTEGDVRQLADLQRQLLRAAAQLVRPGGTVVYATCTLLPEENEQVVEWALAQPDLGLELDDIRPDLPEPVAECAEDRPFVTLTPELFGTDGFFMARLIKRTEA
jgi:16S rRNA (cytosine967-C5)-methyltransferase